MKKNRKYTKKQILESIKHWRKLLNESRYADVLLDVKSLIYKELNPMAKAAGCQLLVLDKGTYKSYRGDLKQKMQRFGVSGSEYRNLRDAIDEDGYVVVLKSSARHSPDEIAACFKHIGLSKDCVKDLCSQDDDLEIKRRNGRASDSNEKSAHFYWFSISLHDAGQMI